MSGSGRSGVFAAAGLLAIAGAVFVARQPDRAAPRGPAGVAEVSRAEVDGLRGELAALRAELALARAASARAPLVERLDAAPAPPTPPPEPLAVTHAVLARVANTFAVEAPDGAWSAPAAASIARDFQASPLRAALRDVACASTLCRLELTLDDPALSEDLAGQLAELRSLETDLYYVHHDDDPSRVTVYAARAQRSHPL
jgi:hypothetical protein